MKLPQTFILVRNELIQRIKVTGTTAKRLIILFGAVIISFMLVLPFTKGFRTETKQIAGLPQAGVSVPVQQQFMPVNDTSKRTKQVTANQNSVANPLKVQSVKDLKVPLTGKELRGTSKNLIWWSILGDYRQHVGVDILAAQGSKVTAAAPGVVTELGTDPVYGKVIVVDHGNGWQTVYGGLENVKVKLNSKVNSGQELAQVGAPFGGEADLEAHLHYEVWHNQDIVNGKNWTE